MQSLILQNYIKELKMSNIKWQEEMKELLSGCFHAFLVWSCRYIIIIVVLSILFYSCVKV